MRAAKKAQSKKKACLLLPRSKETAVTVCSNKCVSEDEKEILFSLFSFDTSSSKCTFRPCCSTNTHSLPHSHTPTSTHSFTHTHTHTHTRTHTLTHFPNLSRYLALSFLHPHSHTSERETKAETES